MSQARETYAIKGLNVMACMFVSTYHDIMNKYGAYDIEKHDQAYLAKFKEFGYAGSRMDDFLPFYEMYANTIDIGIPMRKLLAAKAEHVANSQLGFADFVDDKIMQQVPVAKLDEYLANNKCNDDSLDKVMPKEGATGAKRPWYKNMYVWIGVAVVFALIVCIILFVVFRRRNTSNVSTSNIGSSKNSTLTRAP